MTTFPASSTHGIRRLLWSAIILTLVGCESVPSGSTALFDKLGDALQRPAQPTAPSEGLAGWIAARRAAKATAETAPATSPAPKLPGRWADDEVLQMVIESEFAGATPEERQQWMQRLASADEADIPDLLAERRRSLNHAADHPPENAAPATVRQIILTEPANVNDASTHAHAAEQTQLARRPRSTHPLLEDPASLAAPEPGGTATPEPDVAQISVLSEQPPKLVTTVFDAFGVGGETRAAREQVAGASRIGLAQRDRETSLPEAEAIARDLESDKTAQSVFWQEDLDKLITLLEAQVAQQKPGDTDFSKEQYIRQHVALRMLYLIASRRPEALQAIPAVSHDQQEFWTQMFWALSSTFDEEAMPNSTVRAAETVARLRAAVRQIEPRASLELQGTLFCQQIDGFGDFVSFDDAPFAPGQPVLIYTEVRNFQSQSTPQGDFKTILRSTITIQQESVSGPVVFKYDLPETEDRCLTRRRDYFHSYRIQLPDSLKSGPYVLTLDVTDTLTGKNGSTTLNFVVR